MTKVAVEGVEKEQIMQLSSLLHERSDCCEIKTSSVLKHVRRMMQLSETAYDSEIT